MKNKWFHFRTFTPPMALYVEGEADPAGGAAVADAPVVDPPAADPVSDPGDIDALLAAEIVDDKPVEGEPADPFAAVKDNPQFQELSQAAESFKAVMEAAGSPNVDNLKAQITDAHTLYSVVDGKMPAGALLEQLSVYGPDVQKRVATEVAAWLTDKGFIQGAAPKDPALVEIEKMKAAFQQRQEADQQQALNTRVNGAKSLVHGEIGKFLEAKGLKGQEARFLQMIGPQFAGKEMQLVEAAEKGDFKLVSKALQTAYNNEVKYMQSWFKALKERKQTKQDGIAKIAGSGTVKGEVKKLTARPPNDSPEFIDWMLQNAGS